MFFAMILAVTVFGHLLAYKRLLKDTRLPWQWHLVGALALAVLALNVLTLRRGLDWLPGSVTPWLTRIGWTWFGIISYLLMMLILFAVLESGVALWGWLRRRSAAGSPAVSEERRLLLTRSFAAGTIAATAGISGFGVWRAFTPTRVEEVAIKLPRLPRALDGFTIVQLSDVHVGPLIRRQFVEEVVARVNALKPDIVVLTGDLVDGSPSELGHAVAAFTNLRSRGGTFMITGNHEYYSGDVRWVRAFEGLGINVLRNRRVPIGDTHPGGATLELIGVDDWSARHRYGADRGYNLERAIEGLAPDRATVLLAHQPANWDVAAAAGMSLQLSGHTHGGQMFPMTMLISQVWEHSAGLYRDGESALYVNRGTGFWGPPMRVDSPPEITKIVLTA